MADSTSTATAQNGNGGAAVMTRPFRVGVQQVDDDTYDESKTLTTSTQVMPQYPVPSTGYLLDLYILVTITGSDNSSGANVALNEDGPFNLLESITFTDTNSAEIMGPISGWDLFIIQKYGGYSFLDDARADGVYSVTTGTGGTAGDLTFLLRVPNEMVPRDALGALPNKSNSTPYKLKMTIAASTTLYSTSPDTSLGTVRIRVAPLSYWEPQNVDGSGNPVAQEPPGVNTTQYWSKTDYGVTAGSVSPILDNSVGFPIRNLVFVLRDNTPSRSQGESDWPDPFYLQLQSNILVNRVKAIWKRFIAEDYDYTTAADTAHSKDNGVYVLPFCRDFCHKPGWETRRGYLRTTDGSRLQMKGTIGGSGEHTLTVLTNFVGIGSGTTLAAITS